MLSVRSVKAALFQGSEIIGATRVLRNSSWRSKQLLILAYHGISFENEHEWNPGLYMPQHLLRRRLESIRKLDCSVLPLAEALQRLNAGSLPKRSVVITFDDGNADFYHRAYPVLREFKVPATVYWTTYYSQFPRPVPDVTISFFLWLGRSQRLEWPGMLPEPVVLDLSGRSRARAYLMKYAEERGFDARQKDALLGELAEKLGIDYAEFCRKRILQIMSADEAAKLAHAGVDFQIHTHRHRTPADRDLLLKEFKDNRRFIQEAGAPWPDHFCYPSGYYRHINRDWLSEAGIVSAVTCDPALASRRSDRFDLPRFVDSSSCDTRHFEAWLSGVPQLLPRKKAFQA